MNALRYLPLILFTPLFAQGPLSPTAAESPAVGPANAVTPGGAPQPTMKTLHQVEPRVPVSSLPFTITASGSYYFTRNLHFTAATGNAITIAASGVTLNLNGFALTSDPAVTGIGIHIEGLRKGVTVRNGSISGTSLVGVTESSPGQLTWIVVQASGFSTGVGNVDTSQGFASDCLFEDLHVSACRGFGLSAGAGSRIERCSSSGNAGGGFVFKVAGLSHCTATSNGSPGGFYSPISGSKLSDCIASYNQSAGIAVPGGVIVHCQAMANENGIGGGESTITDSVATANQGYGISNESGTTSNCTAARNLGTGIIAEGGTVGGCVATSNAQHGFHAPDATVTFCKAIGNDGDGIQADYGVVTGSSASLNDGIGINAFGGSVSQSVARNNGQHGIYATQGSISNCAASGNNASATPPFTDIFPSAPNPVSRANNRPGP